ncbi:N-acetyl-1-D-myo-inositol-2-amino-2-deoxy-alpha-D-glucopyranoside deacetylase [Phycicoccus sp. CMS6Z-2]|nr:N-acetyl-1-D-myo-inositol-2-amino-2-deoxy-alpha-D-glucopyranoside deacetylase [Phycicoccus flavus]
MLDGVAVRGATPTLLFVHAHPDDETLTTGVAVAHHAARGHDVHVLTCTLGEEGEVIPPALAHLEGDGPALAAHRRGELARALAALGATGHLLGAAGPEDEPAFRDSGMAGTPAAEHPRAFAGRPLEDAAAAVGRVLAAVRPDVVVTYDAGGGYGHPDHVRTHEATRAAVAALPAGERPVLYGTLTPLTWALEDREWLAAHVPADGPWVVPDQGSPYTAGVVPDDVVGRAVVDPDAVPAQVEALRAHDTQVVSGDGWFALSNHHVFRLAGREGYAVLDPGSGRPAPEGAA